MYNKLQFTTFCNHNFLYGQKKNREELWKWYHTHSIPKLFYLHMRIRSIEVLYGTNEDILIKLSMDLSYDVIKQRLDSETHKHSSVLSLIYIRRSGLIFIEKCQIFQ